MLTRIARAVGQPAARIRLAHQSNECMRQLRPCLLRLYMIAEVTGAILRLPELDQTLRCKDCSTDTPLQLILLLCATIPARS